MIPINLFTWKAKLALVLGVMLATGWYIRHATTKAYEQGVASGKQSGWDDAQQQMKTTMAAEWKKIRDATDELDQIDKQQHAQRTELDRVRRTLNNDLATHLAEITAATLERKQNVQTLPSGSLVPYILRALDNLDQLERERASRPNSPAAN